MQFQHGLPVRMTGMDDLGRQSQSRLERVPDLLVSCTVPSSNHIEGWPVSNVANAEPFLPTGVGGAWVHLFLLKRLSIGSSRLGGHGIWSLGLYAFWSASSAVL